MGCVSFCSGLCLRSLPYNIFVVATGQDGGMQYTSPHLALEFSSHIYCLVKTAVLSWPHKTVGKFLRTGTEKLMTHFDKCLQTLED